MKLSRFVSLSTAVAGGVAAWQLLTRRHHWEQQQNRQVVICVDYDDVQTAAIRAGLPFLELVQQLADNGATHLSLPELTLDRLLALGRLVPQAPSQLMAERPFVGHWNYLHGEPALVAHLAAELNGRLPYTQATAIADNTLAFAGNLPTIGSIGLGFEPQEAKDILATGIGIVPQPIHYDWPEAALIQRTLSQAAQYGNMISFGGHMVLGHEMQLNDTIDTMAAHNLQMAFYAESRHQRGDWFIAKGGAPQVWLAYQMSPEEMMGLDVHTACHQWVHLAQERGVRFCYLNFFRVLHAIEPLEGLHYVHHLKHAFEDAGFVVTKATSALVPQPEPTQQELALTSVAAAGVAATAVADTFQLPDLLATPFVALAAAGAAALPYFEARQAQSHDHHHDHHHDHAHDHHHDHAHDHHHHHDHSHDHDHGHTHVTYTSSYTPKLVALAAATLGPVAALNNTQNATGWLTGLLYQASSAATLAAATTGSEYYLRVETYKGFHLDWLAPLAAAAWQIPQKPIRFAAITALAGAWIGLNNRPSLLDTIDAAPPLTHTHHISAATRVVGDLGIKLGPRPARKWAGLGPAAYGLSVLLQQREQPTLAAAVTTVGVVGNMMGLVGFHHSERAIQKSSQEAATSMAVGTLFGLFCLLMGKAK